MASIRWVKQRNRWWVRWHATHRPSGRVLTGSQVFLEKGPAYQSYLEMEAQEQLWRSGVIDTVDSIADAVTDFESHCRQHTVRTQEHYRRIMQRFLASLPRNIVRVQQLDAKCIQEYLYRLRDAGAINRTLNAHLTVIKSFCRWCGERYKVRNVASCVRMMVEEPPEIHTINRAEYLRLLRAAGLGLWRDRIAFVAHTGLRASEFCSLVRTGKLRQGRSLTIIGKGRRKRTIPLNRHARKILSRPHIYRPIGRGNLGHKILELGRRAGLGEVGPHTLRHYCATQMLLGGVPIAKVAEILGHSIRVCEGTYKHFIPADLAGTTDVLD